MKRRVVITGLGAVTPIGLNVEEFWIGLAEGRNGIGPITLFDAAPFPTRVAAEVKGFDPEKFMPIKRVDRTSRVAHLAIAAAKMAVESAKLEIDREDPSDIGVVISTSGMTSLIAQYGEILKTKPSRIDPLFIGKVAQSMVPAQVGLELGCKGLNTSLNSACASGSDALGTALSHIQLGHAEVVLAGGSEAGVNPVALAATGRVGALSKELDPAKASRPFDLNRGGFVIGEGAGMLVLEELEHAQKRGAAILAELVGAGWSFDAFNDLAPDPVQESLAMKKAIRDAGLEPGDIDYVNAHGTGTRLNDASETQAIKLVFGERAYQIPLSSNKSMIGHLACAAGAVEAVATVLTINHGILPPTINYETPDPECDLDCIPNRARRQQVNNCLSNSFGMGGQNCCLVIRRYV